MELEEYKELVSTYTKDPDVSKKTWAVSSKLCMLFVEFRHMDIIKHNLNNICNVYGGGETALVILYSGDNEDIIMETTKDWKNVIYRKMFDTNVTVKEYDRIFTSYDFWDSLSEFDYVLTNSWDSYIFKKIPDKFYKYDIVGGPCGHFFVPLEGRLMNICSNVCKCPRCLEYNHHFKESNFKNHFIQPASTDDGTALGAAYYCWQKGVEIVGPNRATMFVQLMPLLSAILAIIIFREKLELYHFIGASFILSGIYLSNRKLNA